MKKEINIAVVGFGNVGYEVSRIISLEKSLLRKKSGIEISIAAICEKDRNKWKVPFLVSNVFTDDINSIIENKNIDIVVELIGNSPGVKNLVLNCIRNKKQIVTANKALLAQSWGEIFSEAEKNKVWVYFEASVASGVPVIRALNEGLAANNIKSITGILNGTTNYILTQMTRNRMDFNKALEDAKAKGYAESDPSLDISGHDALHKLIILASLAYGAGINAGDVACEGISNVEYIDINYAGEEFGLILKLLGIVKNHNGRLEMRVSPAFIPMTHPFANVDNEYNAILVNGDNAGDVMFYGKGAGGRAAASAVVSDVIYLARHIVDGTAGVSPYINFDEKSATEYIHPNKIRNKYYLRFSTADKPGVLSCISGILGRNNISIDSCFQKPIVNMQKKYTPILMVTHLASEHDINKALNLIDKLNIIRKKTVKYRIES